MSADVATLDVVRPPVSRVRHSDLTRAGAIGIRSRPLRSALSALGISIGIAALVAVVGISQSSKSVLLAQFDKLSNLLTVQPGQSIFGEQVDLPATAVSMVRCIGPVTAVTAVQKIDEPVYRNSHIAKVQTGGITVLTADAGLLSTLDGSVRSGTFLNVSTMRYPAVVLGASAARVLGIESVEGSRQILIGGEWFTVVGVLDTVAAAPEIDRAALIGNDIAVQLFGIETHASELYVRTDPAQADGVQAILAQTANPSKPSDATVGRPSDLIQAKLAAKGAYNSLLLGLGAVALLVGGVGIANVMVISVLERRREIGLRRATGATRRQIGEQFVIESLALSTIGGIAGSTAGAAATAIYATSQHWRSDLPVSILLIGPALAAAIGALAGLYPAMQAARLAPTAALRTT